MTIPETPAEVIAQLAKGDVATRRAAVRQAVELLKQPACTEPCRTQLIAALRAAAEQDPAISVRDLALASLNDLPPQPTASLLPDDRQHMLGVRCPNGHVTYFDKRRICTDKTAFVRTLVRDEAGRELDRLALPCDACDEITTIRVDCRGYQ